MQCESVTSEMFAQCQFADFPTRNYTTIHCTLANYADYPTRNYTTGDYNSVPVQERSNSGRIPVKLKLSCKQGGREQAVRSHTLPIPHAASKQLSATALGSVDASLVASAAVHTLIPNLAPRSRFTHTAGAAATGSSAQASGQSHDACDELSCGQPHGQSADAHAGVAEWDEESGPHQEAQQALFDATMHVLRPKLAQPVLVNFLSVAGKQQIQCTSLCQMLSCPCVDRLCCVSIAVPLTVSDRWVSCYCQCHSDLLLLCSVVVSL